MRGVSFNFLLIVLWVSSFDLSVAIGLGHSVCICSGGGPVALEPMSRSALRYGLGVGSILWLAVASCWFGWGGAGLCGGAWLSGYRVSKDYSRLLGRRAGGNGANVEVRLALEHLHREGPRGGHHLSRCCGRVVFAQNFARWFLSERISRLGGWVAA